jgi:hypothetical protein
MRRPLVSHVVATRHEHVMETCALPTGGVLVTRVLLPAPPVATVSAVESIMGGWWLRSGGYPVGRVFSSFIER